MFRAHVYTADFKILIPVEHKELCQYFKVPDFRCKEPGCACFWVDVKGEFARNDGQRSFTLNQKWVYDKFGVYVHKVVPVKFFDKFGVPAEARFTPKTNKPRRIYYGKRLLSSVAKKFSAN